MVPFNFRKSVFHLIVCSWKDLLRVPFEYEYKCAPVSVLEPPWISRFTGLRESLTPMLPAAFAWLRLEGKKNHFQF